MRSLNFIGTKPASLPLAAEDIVEFHAARLLLLLHVCGVSGRIDGLTKMAKLDFFARYPDFFEVARAATTSAGKKEPVQASSRSATESAMVRHHYGPWDKRYYHVLAHLEAKRLVTVTKAHNSYQLSLTDIGRDTAKSLSAIPSYGPLVDRMRQVKKTFGAKSGSTLKDLIYRVFDEEIGQRPLGQVIRK